MRRRKLLLIGSALFLLSFKSYAPPAELTDAERKTAISYLTSTRENVLKSIEGLSETQLDFKSTLDSWSIKQCVEHIALVETNLWEMIQGTLREPANPSKRSEIKLSDDGVFTKITDRSFKVQAPEPVQPSGKFTSFEKSVEEFLDRRKKNIDYVKTTHDDLRSHFHTFPGAFGTLDTYQLIIFMAGHSRRHTLQIEEVKRNPGFPK